MQYAYTRESRVLECIPERIIDDHGNSIRLEDRYSEEFLRCCFACSDVVKEGWLYDGTSFTAPAQDLSEVKYRQRASIRLAHEAAMKGSIALSDPSLASVAVEASLLAVSDPEGLEWLRDSLASHRKALETLVDNATTVAEVEVIDVRFPV